MSVEERLARLEAQVEAIKRQANIIEMLLKYVVTPLIVLIGALAGIQLAV